MKKRNIKLDKEEKEILTVAEKGELVSAPLTKKGLRELQQAAQATLKKNKTISIRISEYDLLRLKARAAKEGLPYQTLITSTLHKLVSKNL